MSITIKEDDGIELVCHSSGFNINRPKPELSLYRNLSLYRVIDAIIKVPRYSEDRSKLRRALYNYYVRKRK